ncbi:hopene-associated glycosyltransferase HpnB [Rhizobiales bacterium GAS191]|nr:hopene-associated glycosyltransferase HpnB [Rhizobiales bacterium GAS188]SED15399.1 hopene-associated glycosyltransferase HpnB [Rhizobiales bacterium GAS191]
MIVALVSVLSLGIWAYLLLARGRFWRCDERDDTLPLLPRETKVGDALHAWPSVTAVVPARDEAATIAHTILSLLRQDYAGRFSVVLVDDQSSDDTAAIASAAAKALGAASQLAIVTGMNIPPGWTGKLWAMRQGLAAVENVATPSEFILFTDADIAYEPQALRRLVEIALVRESVLTSLMVKLRCESLAEHLLVPAFVFFFQKLYPFAWVNDPARATAAAAGGCMLARCDVLKSAGGLEAVRGALIDDCALGALMKKRGPVWLGLTESVHSLRAYPAFGDFRRMVVRSAFAELRYSTLNLIATVAGMALIYLVPPLMTLFAHGAAQAAGAIAWAMMAVAFAPTLRFYGRPVLFGLALPAIAAVYTGFTIESAWQYWRGRGGHWKGRFQASAKGAGGA